MLSRISTIKIIINYIFTLICSYIFCILGFSEYILSLTYNKYFDSIDKTLVTLPAVRLCEMATHILVTVKCSHLSSLPCEVRTPIFVIVCAQTHSCRCVTCVVISSPLYEIRIHTFASVRSAQTHLCQCAKCADTSLPLCEVRRHISAAVRSAQTHLCRCAKWAGTYMPLYEVRIHIFATVRSAQKHLCHCAKCP